MSHVGSVSRSLSHRLWLARGTAAESSHGDSLDAEGPRRVAWLLGESNLWADGWRLPILLRQWPHDRFPLSVFTWNAVGPIRDCLSRSPVQWRDYPGRQRTNLGQRRRWLADLSGDRPDLVHAWSSDEAVWSTLRGRRPDLINHLSGQRRRLAERWLWRQSAPPSCLVHDPWSYESAVQSGLDPMQIRMIDGLSVEALASDPLSTAGERDEQEDLSEISRRGPGVRRIAALSTLSSRGGMEDLIWSLDLLLSTDPDWELWVFGAGPWEPALRRFARQTHTDHAVRFVDDSRAWFRQRRSFVALWLGADEPQLYPWIQNAVAWNVPIVATDTPWNRRLREPLLAANSSRDVAGDPGRGPIQWVPFGRAGRADRARATRGWAPPLGEGVGVVERSEPPASAIGGDRCHPAESSCQTAQRDLQRLYRELLQNRSRLKLLRFRL